MVCVSSTLKKIKSMSYFHSPSVVPDYLKRLMQVFALFCLFVAFHSTFTLYLSPCNNNGCRKGGSTAINLSEKQLKKIKSKPEMILLQQNPNKSGDEEESDTDNVLINTRRANVFIIQQILGGGYTTGNSDSEGLRVGETIDLSHIRQVQMSSLAPSEVAFCISGESNLLYLTGSSLVKKFLGLQPNVSVFISTVLDGDTYKLQALGDANIKGIRTQALEVLELISFLQEVFSVENEEAREVALNLKLAKGCLKLFETQEQKQKSLFTAMAYSGMNHLWSKKLISSMVDVGTLTMAKPEKDGEVSFTAAIGSAFLVKALLSVEDHFFSLREKWMNASSLLRSVKLGLVSRKDLSLPKRAELLIDHGQQWSALKTNFLEQYGRTPKEVVQLFLRKHHLPLKLVNLPFCELKTSQSNNEDGNSVSIKSKMAVNGAKCVPCGEKTKCTSWSENWPEIIDSSQGEETSFWRKRLKVFDMDVCLAYLPTVFRKTEILQGPDATKICARGYLGETTHLGSVYGGWTVFLQSLNANSIIFSVGIGRDITFDLSLIHKYGCQVYAFDNTPISMNWLKKQFPPPQWHLYPFLLGNKNGNVTLAMPKGFGGSFASVEADARGFRNDVLPVTLPARTLETLMEISHVDKVDILKMDIEGGEFGVIAGWKEAQNPPKVCQILVEFHGRLFKKGEELRFSAISAMESLGFVLAACDYDGFNSDDCLFFSPSTCISHRLT